MQSPLSVTQCIQSFLGCTNAAPLCLRVEFSRLGRLAARSIGTPSGQNRWIICLREHEGRLRTVLLGSELEYDPRCTDIALIEQGSGTRDQSGLHLVLTWTRRRLRCGHVLRRRQDRDVVSLRRRGALIGEARCRGEVSLPGFSPAPLPFERLSQFGDLLLRCLSLLRSRIVRLAQLPVQGFDVPARLRKFALQRGSMSLGLFEGTALLLGVPSAFTAAGLLKNKSAFR